MTRAKRSLALLRAPAAEINPCAAVDGFEVGDGTIGPLTRKLDRLFNDVARGIDTRFPEWRTPVS